MITGDSRLLQKVTVGDFVTDPGSSFQNQQGLDCADIDGDGDVDVLVANYGADNDMYTNEGGGELRKVTEGAFVTDFKGDFGSGGMRLIVHVVVRP
jgi:hypothetical protein